jgi:hypothetical protein
VVVWGPRLTQRAPDVLLVDECLGQSDPAAQHGVQIFPELSGAGNITIGGPAISPRRGIIPVENA